MREASVGSIGQLHSDSGDNGAANSRSICDQPGVFLQQCLSRKKNQQFLTDTVVDSRRTRLTQYVSLLSQTQLVNSADGDAMENTKDNLLQGSAFKRLITHPPLVMNTAIAVKQSSPDLPIHRIIPYSGSLSSACVATEREQEVNTIHQHIHASGSQQITKHPCLFQEISRIVPCYVMETGGPSDHVASLSTKLISYPYYLFNKTNNSPAADPPPDMFFLTLCEPISYVEYTNKLTSLNFILHSSSSHCMDIDKLDKDNIKRTSMASILQETVEDMGTDIEPGNIVCVATPSASCDNSQTDMHRLSSHALALQNLLSPNNYYKKETDDQWDEDDLSLQTYQSVCSWLTSLSYDGVDSSPTDVPKWQSDSRITGGHSDIALNGLIANTITSIVTDIKKEESDIELDELIKNTIATIETDIKNDQSDIKLDELIANTISTIATDIHNDPNDIKLDQFITNTIASINSDIKNDQSDIQLEEFIANAIATIVSDIKKENSDINLDAFITNTIASIVTDIKNDRSDIKLEEFIANAIAAIVSDIKKEKSGINLDEFVTNTIATIVTDIEKEGIQCFSVGDEQSDIRLEEFIANSIATIVSDIKKENSDLKLDEFITKTIATIVTDIEKEGIQCFSVESDIKLDELISNTITTIVSESQKECSVSNVQPITQPIEDSIQCCSEGGPQSDIKLDGLIANTIATIVSESQKECSVSNGLPIAELSSDTIQCCSKAGEQSDVKLDGCITNTIATIVSDIQLDGGTMSNGHLVAVRILPIQTQSGSGQSDLKLDGPIVNNVSTAVSEIVVNGLQDMKDGSFTLDTWHQYVFSEMSREKADSEYEGDDRMFQKMLEPPQGSHTTEHCDSDECLVVDTGDESLTDSDDGVGSALDRLSMDTVLECKVVEFSVTSQSSTDSSHVHNENEAVEESNNSNAIPANVDIGDQDRTHGIWHTITQTMNRAMYFGSFVLRVSGMYRI